MFQGDRGDHDEWCQRLNSEYGIPSLEAHKKYIKLRDGNWTDFQIIKQKYNCFTKWDKPNVTRHRKKELGLQQIIERGKSLTHMQTFSYSFVSWKKERIEKLIQLKEQNSQKLLFFTSNMLLSTRIS